MKQGSLGWRRGRFTIMIVFLVLLAGCRSAVSLEAPPTDTALPPTLPAAVTSTSEPATPTVIPETPTSPPPTAATTAQCTVIAQRGLRLRGGPGTEYEVVATLLARDVVTGTGRSTEGDWVAVRTAGGQDGWVASNFVDCGGPVLVLPEATPSAPPPLR